MSSLRELIRIQGTFLISDSVSPTPSFPTRTDDHSLSSSSNCHGYFHNAALVVPSTLFVLYLAFHAKNNLKKPSHGRSYIIIAYYVLLWFSALLNLVWCSLQAWQCIPEKEVAWNLLSLFTASAMLCLEISSAAFLLQENYASGLEILTHTFIFSGIIVCVDILLKAIFIFGFGVPLFIDGESMQWAKWGLLIVHKLLLTAVYGYILFVHYSRWKDKLPSRPGFCKYIIVMFVVNVMAFLACGLASTGAGFGVWLYTSMVICYHSLYLPFLYVTFLAYFFQEEDLLLNNAYYFEMRDAGFFDADWD